eukprot:2548083-Amphidinium_carterae.2
MGVEREWVLWSWHGITLVFSMLPSCPTISMRNVARLEALTRDLRFGVKRKSLEQEHVDAAASSTLAFGAKCTRAHERLWSAGLRLPGVASP